MHLIQNYVSAQRVSDFLEEEESMKNAQYSERTGASDPPIGCVNATFTHLSEQEALAASAPATAAMTANSAAAGLTSATFKLVDVTVSFPLDGLSIITGVRIRVVPKLMKARWKRQDDLDHVAAGRDDFIVRKSLYAQRPWQQKFEQD